MGLSSPRKEFRDRSLSARAPALHGPLRRVGMTYSIVARDPKSGAFGVAVASHVLACGSGVGAVSPWGAAASQARAGDESARTALVMLKSGASALDVGTALMAGEPSRAEQQMGIVDSVGGSWTYTGSHCFVWAGGRTGLGFAVQGNVLSGRAVVDAISERFVEGNVPFRELLVASLAAGFLAGGDARGPQSAALKTSRMTPLGEEFVDLRVDDREDPIAELGRLVELYGTYGDTGEAADLVRLDPTVVALVQAGLGKADMTPTSRRHSRAGAGASPAPLQPSIGMPAPYANGWTDDWQRALLDWMEIENLELRYAAAGWVDKRVLEKLRTLSERPSSSRS
jgi:uncharacterized Ntn-hydrolase superfamily protein